MTYRVDCYKDLPSFRAVSLDWLAPRHIANNMLYLGLERMSPASLAVRASWLGILRQDQAVAGIALINSPLPHRTVQLSHPWPEEASPALATALGDAGVRLSGIHAREAAAIALAAALARPYKTRFALGQYVLQRPPRSEAAGSGRLRPAQPGDQERLCKWLTGFIADCRLADDPTRLPAEIGERLARAQPFYWIWEEDGEAVALASATRLGDCARIGAVYTPPARRRRGHGEALVASLCRLLQGQGVGQIHLDTDLANPVSNALYRRIGFEQIGEKVELILL